MVSNDTPELTARPPDEAEINLARDLTRRLAPPSRRQLSMRLAEDGEAEEIALSSHIVELLLQVLTETAKGNAVTIVPIHAELTTQQSADLLGVSRPFLIGLLEKGEIEFRRVGTHRRVRYQDLAAYAERQRAARKAALDELSAIGQELQLDD
ncbi:helix-turn-helix domain-containing protein [Engelhardtia mirabilis]|uniref:Helix-turn-helix domain protein n=1 Tax=Engelhardtia mirabilis TaxID=2528011 RepID=A0A518BGX4_9BACT|nr:Helix-turn-helix domain protein [Planctomycetes bacterium Pla133]QDV00552.1 Helix-turn-helix domain protein [Planctomycetes bacterium Pla86]